MGTEGAFKKLNEVYGTLKSGAPMKKGYHLPRAQMENADIARIINSTEVQSVLRPKMDAPKSFEVKKNALKNKAVMEQLNPYASEAAKKASADGSKRKERLQASREHNKKHKRGDDTFYRKLMKAFEAKAKESEEKDEEAEEDE